MNILGRQFAPPVWAVVLYLIVCVAMLALGRWQLLRADEKIAILSAAQASASEAPQALSSLESTETLQMAAERFARVQVNGQWHQDRQFLWDNRAHASQAGLEVITPLELADGRLVLVNRGWTPLGATRDQLPDVGLDASSATVVGALSRPSKGFAGGQAFDSGAPWPRYLQYFDYGAIQSALQSDVLPVVLQVDHAAPGPWLVSNWQPAASGPEKHYAYAVQWFGMAIALTVIFFVVNRRAPAPTPRKQ